MGWKTTDHRRRVGNTDTTRGKSYSGDLTLGGFVNKCPTFEGKVAGEFEFMLNASQVDSSQAEPTASAKLATARIEAHLNDDGTIRELDMLAEYVSDINGVRSGSPPFRRTFRVGQLGEPDWDAVIEAAVVTGDMAVAALMWNAGMIYFAAQTGWLKPDECVEFTFDPPSDVRALRPNESVEVRATARTKEGNNAVAKAHMEGGPLDRIGQLSPRTGDAREDGQFTFTYTASANPKKGHGFDIGATSRAGGAKGQWRITDALSLKIEHRLLSRRDTPQARLGRPLYDGTVRFEINLEPFPTLPGEFRGEAQVVRQLTVGHITPRCTGQGSQTETWRVNATVDATTGTMKLGFAVFGDDLTAYWICDGQHSEVTSPARSELRLNAPLSMPSRSGSRQTFTPSGPLFQETLTVTVP